MKTTPRLVRKAASALIAAGAVLALVTAPAPGADTSGLPALGDVVPKSATDDNSWLSFGSGITPGAAIRVGSLDNDDKATRCTVGFTGSNATSKLTVLTAGHCFRKNGPNAWYSVAGEQDYRTLGSVTSFQVRESTGTQVPFETDFATVPVTAGIGNKGTKWVADQYRVTKVFDRTDLRKGMTLCKYGYRTEETCGPIISVDDTFVRAEVFSLGGDSGGPAYVKLGDGTVAAVGLLSGSPRRDGVVDDTVTDFALVAPVIKVEGLSLF